MIKLKDLITEAKYTVDFDIGSSGLMSRTVDARDKKEAAKKVAAGIRGKVKIKKVSKAKPIKLRSKSGMGKISHLGMETVNEAPGKSGKDQYYGAARVKVEPYTYKNQKRDFHDVSMYRDHKKPYHYYLSIKLAHSNKVDMVVDTGTHIQSKAGKWAQGFIKRRMDGTGKERFS